MYYNITDTPFKVTDTSISFNAIWYIMLSLILKAQITLIWPPTNFNCLYKKVK